MCTGLPCVRLGKYLPTVASGGCGSARGVASGKDEDGGAWGRRKLGDLLGHLLRAKLRQGRTRHSINHISSLIPTARLGLSPTTYGHIKQPLFAHLSFFLPLHAPLLALT